MTDKKLLSVIIPTYNCEKYISETVGSVRDNMSSDIEIILTDDGSSDATPRILKESYGRDERIKPLFLPHRGAAAARNEGMKAAVGEYITFLDCDDCMQEEYLSEVSSYIAKGIDYYIFGIERIFLDGRSELWSVPDRVYNTVSDFADEYVRKRRLLIYSNCNKLYKRSIIERAGLRFDESLSFGEDRCFNYEYLKLISNVMTVSLPQIRYIQRDETSMSTISFSGYYETAEMLHEKKMDCFLALSSGTTDEEKRNFAAYDITKETKAAIDRIEAHPEEKDEIIAGINRRAFSGTDDEAHDVDIIIILGSMNCGYKAEKAFQYGHYKKDMIYIPSGGNMQRDGVYTEGDYMARCLKDLGIRDEFILTEAKAKNTFENFKFSEEIINESCPKKKGIGIITSGFHLKRTQLLLKKSGLFADKEVFFIPAYGPVTAPDTWYKHKEGRRLILSEVYKVEWIISKG